MRQFAANYHDRAAARAAVGHIAAAFEALPEVDRAAPGGLSFCFLDQDGDWRPPVAPPRKRTRGSCIDTPRGCHNPRLDEDMTGSAALSVRDLTLHAPDRNAAVLDQASFTVLRGEKLALMGESGSGKTSLLEALLGLRAVQSGEIHLFGRALTLWSQADLRSEAVLIGQQPFFLPGSIADNLRLAQPQASEEALHLALKAACAQDFVAALPRGLHTMLGAEGYGLSGGQLHRLALARVFLTSAELILLDEPTAHLDADSRDGVLDSLLMFATGRTLLIATHDPAVAGRLQRTLQILDGKVLS